MLRTRGHAPSKMADDDEIPPPLEDMSHCFNKNRERRVANSDSSLLGLEHSTSLHKELLIVKEPLSEQGKTKGFSKVPPPKGSDKNSFGGMKKGFLFSSNKRTISSVRQQEKVKDIPFVKPVPSKGLEFDEVQEEMKKAYPFLTNKDWMTEDLLKKIEDNPILSKAFTDPAFSDVLEEFHRNPEESMKRANPEVRKFLQEFCSLMGDHFTSLGSSQPAVSEEHITEQLSEDDKRMKDALTRPEVQQVLKDENIQKLMNSLMKDRNEAQRYLDSNTSHEFHSKVRILIEHGVLNVQRQ